MRTRLSEATAVIVAVGALACGGDGTGPGGGGGGTGSGFRAVIDGQAWEAQPISIAAMAGGGPGAFIVTGSQTTGGTVRSINLLLNNVTGPGTYALGVLSGVYGGTGQVGEGSGSGGSGNSWSTPSSGVAGSMTITTLSAGHIVATFAFVAEPGISNAVGGTRTVTNGVIDLPLGGTLAPVPDNVGGRVTATLNGVPYGAATINAQLTVYTGGPGVTISTISSQNGISITLEGVTAPGTFTFSNTAPVRFITAGRNTSTNCCWGLNAGGDVLTITVTSITATRVKGTFSGTLQPHPGAPSTVPLAVTDGVFDVGID